MSLKEGLRSYSFQQKKKLPKANVIGLDESSKIVKSLPLKSKSNIKSEQLSPLCKDEIDSEIKIKIENSETKMLQVDNVTEGVTVSSHAENNGSTQGTTLKKVRSKTKKQVKIEFENNLNDFPCDNIKTEELEKKNKLEPPSWSLVLDNIREMRKGREAPVDNMGCDKCMDESAPPQVTYVDLIMKICKKNV